MNDSVPKDPPLNCDSTDNGDSDSSHGGSSFSMDESLWSFPRLEALRTANHTPHITPVKLHHIVRRKTSDNVPFYRVRICRSCTSSDDTIYLGSYTDLESAILVNDAHELMHNRSTHIHVLTPKDVQFIDTLTVTRTWRNNSYQVNLLHLLQERLSRNTSLPARDAMLQHDSVKVPFLDISSLPSPTSAASSCTSIPSPVSYSAAHVSHATPSNAFVAPNHEVHAEEDLEGTLALELKRFRSFRSQIQLSHLKCIASSSSDEYVMDALISLVELLLHENIYADPPAPIHPTTIRKKRRLESILKTAIQCGCLSVSLLHLLASCYAPTPVSNSVTHQSAVNVAGIPAPTAIAAATTIGVFNRSLREVIGNDPIVSTTLTSDLTDHVTAAVTNNQPAYIWGDTMEQLLRINHTVSLKACLDLHLPLWDAVSGTSPDDLFFGECKLRSTWVMIHHHSGVVEVLIRNLLNARQVLVAGVMAGFGGGVAADTNRMHNLMELGVATLTLSHSALATASLLLHRLKLTDSQSVSSVEECYNSSVSWSSFVQVACNSSNILPLAIYQSIKLDLLRVVWKSGSNGSACNNAPSEASNSSGIDTYRSNDDVLVLNIDMTYEILSNISALSSTANNKDEITFDIFTEMKLRLAISLMCTLHATQLGPYIPRFPSILAVVASTLRQLLEYCEATTATAFFAHTQLSLLYLIEVVDELLQHNENQQLLQEIFSMSECVLRIFATRMKLSRMLLLQVEGIKNRSCRSRTTSHDNISANSVPLPVKNMGSTVTSEASEEDTLRKRKRDDISI